MVGEQAIRNAAPTILPKDLRGYCAATSQYLRPERSSMGAGVRAGNGYLRCQENEHACLLPVAS